MKEGLESEGGLMGKKKEAWSLISLGQSQKSSRVKRKHNFLIILFGCHKLIDI